jgi:hypothetical protein
MVDLSDIADDFRERSSDFDIFDLQVFHVQDKQNEDDEFILIGLNESNSDAVKVFEDWENQWRNNIARESTELFDETKNIVIHEYRIIDN